MMYYKVAVSIGSQPALAAVHSVSSQCGFPCQYRDRCSYYVTSTSCLTSLEGNQM